MQKIFPLLIVSILLLTLPAKSQITITSADFPVVGNMVVYNRDITTVIDPGQPGLNQVWDFGNLLAEETDSVLYLNAAGLPGYNSFPGADMALSYISGLSPGDYNYNFVNVTANGWQALGLNYRFSVLGIITASVYGNYSPAPYILPVPFTYGNVSNQSFVMNLYVGFNDGASTVDTSYTKSHVTSTMTADGSGVMIIPAGQYQVIRVKEELTTVDSSFLYIGGTWQFDLDTTYSGTQYRWYANGLGEVGSYDGDGQGFTYIGTKTIVGIHKTEAKKQLDIYPNPAQNRINIRTDASIETTEIITLTGTVVQKDKNTGSIDINNLSPGIYTLKAYTDRGVESGRFVKK
jgi:hypothetical protein